MSDHTGGTTTTRTPGALADPEARRALMAGVSPEPGSSKPDSILEVDQIIRNFGGMTAVHVEHLEVQRGIITALIGPNGAGKTTFFNLITGFDRPSSAGSGAAWEFDGKAMSKTS
ncbi:MAG: ATP-binding cassette domain-containing protein, partial [Nocardioides sp.]